MSLQLAPKKDQPKGGFKHPKHLLAYGPTHRAWSLGRGWYETNQYCISPSSKIYDAKLLNN